MLVLSRKVGEAIRIGNDVEVVVLGSHNGRVKIGISAPRHVGVFRGELDRTPHRETMITEAWMSSGEWASATVAGVS